ELQDLLALQPLDMAHEAVLGLEAVALARRHARVPGLDLDVHEAAAALRESGGDLALELFGPGDVHRMRHAAAERERGEVGLARRGGRARAAAPRADGLVDAVVDDEDREVRRRFLAHDDEL